METFVIFATTSVFVTLTRTGLNRVVIAISTDIARGLSLAMKVFLKNI